MRQCLPRTGSPHAALFEIPCVLIEDPTMCRTTAIEIPSFKVDPWHSKVNFISLFDVDAFCLVGKRSGHQSLTLEGPRSRLVSWALKTIKLESLGKSHSI
jgi:hypothetical protein